MISSLPALLAGGVEPEDASPGIGAFITFAILALVIVLLAWSFTRHQRRIRANARKEEGGRAGADAADGAAQAGEADPRAEESSPAPAEEAPDAVEAADPDAASNPPESGRPEDDGGAQR